jgi:hypothetical protein
MKTLDDAVIELNGVYPEFTGDSYDKGSFYVCCRLRLHESVGRGYGGHLICEKEQFQQRAKELGFINGYRYGVEYKTDGKRPNLPDDVVVKTNMSTTADTVDVWIWCNIKSFKITDPRYQPADTSYLEKPALEPVPEEESWYDYDNQKALRLPPVDLICEAYSFKREKWIKAKILNAATGRNEMAVAALAEDGHWSDLFWCCKFRPTDHADRKAKAERKRALDVIYSKWNERGDIVEVAEWLYDKGFLKLPE